MKQQTVKAHASLTCADCAERACYLISERWFEGRRVKWRTLLVCRIHRDKRTADHVTHRLTAPGERRHIFAKELVCDESATGQV